VKELSKNHGVWTRGPFGYLRGSWRFLAKLGSCSSSVSLEKDIIEGMTSGSRARGRRKMNWINNVTSWTALTIEGAIRAADDRVVWRKIVYDATKLVLRTVDDH